MRSPQVPKTTTSLDSFSLVRYSFSSGDGVSFVIPLAALFLTKTLMAASFISSFVRVPANAPTVSSTKNVVNNNLYLMTLSHSHNDPIAGAFSYRLSMPYMKSVGHLLIARPTRLGVSHCPSVKVEQRRSPHVYIEFNPYVHIGTGTIGVVIIHTQ